MTIEQLTAQIEALKAQNAILAANAAKPKGPSLKVSPKGAVSLYGMGRWPVTLYAEQWQVVIDMVPNIKQFLLDYQDSLSTKE